MSLQRTPVIGPIAAVCLVAAVLAGCAAGSRSPAPVEDRGSMAPTRPLAGPAQGAPSVPRPLPGAENAGKPGYYTVRPGDTVVRIGLDFGQNWRDIVRWNNLSNPNTIEVGQVLRVQPPQAAVATSEPTTRPVQQSAVTPLPATSTASRPAEVASQAGVAPAAPAASAASAPVPAEDEITWLWPAPGNASVLAGFDEVKNKGLDIGGKAGDPVLAAADGRVVYAGAGLRGYGNLIILKHNNTYLTAYAHNQALLVKEDQTVRKGQKIAEMGSTDADRAKLHFEIRRQGKPVDPSRYLVAR